MKIDNIQLYNFLREKGVNNFYHANTISTSITFIENNGLLSRGLVESNGLHQTSQDSDAEDKLFDVWDDIFIDTVDLHGFFPRQNLYGPVLFEIDNRFLLENNLDIWVTKNNPMFWNEKTPQEDRYFQGFEDLNMNWEEYAMQRKMFTIRKVQRPVLFNYLQRIVLDNPRVMIHGDTNLFIEARNAIYRATAGFPELRAMLDVRECNNCYCHDNYLKQFTSRHLSKLFLPRQHQRFVN
eukprot:TRINITY_DN4163_c0_g1_i1.p2 TRINITY_DN4163_c0_g1~~TRINITY_DN4163_c0_g1_i1.p2  ORF type:complete len:238 (-),score=26.92 TRINITY_DN4163_c0_g1_i1:245-958(-)